MPADKGMQRAPLRQGAEPYARPHKCSRCNAAFGRADHLRTHVRTVHEKRRDYGCPHCSAAFGQKGA